MMMRENFICPVSEDKSHDYEISAWRKTGNGYKAAELICKHCLKKVPYSNIKGYCDRSPADSHDDL